MVPGTSGGAPRVWVVKGKLATPPMFGQLEAMVSAGGGEELASRYPRVGRRALLAETTSQNHGKRNTEIRSLADDEAYVWADRG